MAKTGTSYLSRNLGGGRQKPAGGAKEKKGVPWVRKGGEGFQSGGKKEQRIDEDPLKSRSEFPIEKKRGNFQWSRKKESVPVKGARRGTPFEKAPLKGGGKGKDLNMGGKKNVTFEKKGKGVAWGENRPICV